MSNENYGYLALLIFIFAVATYVYKLIEIRVTRATLLDRYKPGTTQYRVIQKSLSWRRLAAASVVLVFSLVVLILDVYGHKHLGDFLFIAGFTLAVVAIGLVLIPRVLYSKRG